MLAGIIEHIHPAFVDCVLLAVGRDYSSDVASGTIVREVCIVHDDPWHIQVSMIYASAAEIWECPI